MVTGRSSGSQQTLSASALPTGSSVFPAPFWLSDVWRRRLVGQKAEDFADRRLVGQRGDARVALAGVQPQPGPWDALGGLPEQLGGVVAVAVASDHQGWGGDAVQPGCGVEAVFGVG